jgi:hypothetical protein
MRRHGALTRLVPGYARGMAEKIRDRRDRMHGARWAMIVNTSVSYGLGRMIEMTIEADGIDMGVFHDYDEGLRWVALGRPKRA